MMMFLISNLNRPFPSSLLPLFQNKSKCKTFHMKMNSACSFIFMQITVVFISQNGFALRLALKQGYKGTRKWLIRDIQSHLGDLHCISIDFS